MIARLIAIVRSAAATPTSPLYLAAGALFTAGGLTLLSRYQRAQLEAVTVNAALIEQQEAAIDARTVRLAELRAERRAAVVDQVLENRDS